MDSRTRIRLGRSAGGLTGLAVVAVLAATGVPASASTPTGPLVGVIVRATSAADVTRVQAAVRQSGGAVGRPLALISGFAAQVPSGALPALRAAGGVAEVTADTAVRMKADKWIDDGGKNIAVDSVKKAAGGKKKDNTVDTASLTGAGIGVALIDSGVAPVTGLNQPGKVINGPDLSFESQTPGLADIDTYGHGTHMAGIIAGSDPTTSTGAVGFQGVAPGAHLISLKVAAADGASDVSQVIAGIDWVVSHRNDPGLNIRVLNLSFGTDSSQDEKLDPISYAVEAAWRNGIVVVVSVGNDGAAATRVTMPAANPYVIAVGAADPNGTDVRTDDTVATFSTRGNAGRHADLLAAGRSVVSLRDPGSYIDDNYPGARVADAAGQLRFFRGSGTSQAAAVVSGSVALLLQQRPGLTPDQVKNLLVQSADPLTGADPIATGAGQLDIAGAATLQVPLNAKQSYPAATGLGSLEGSRGSAHVAAAATGLLLTGEKDIFGAPWTPATWTAAAKNGKAWSGGTWNGKVWAGSAFTGQSWASGTWGTVTWSSLTWSGQSWTSGVWSGRSWAAGSWSGRSWAGATWCGRSWTGRSWA
ncbi:S8 family serine peptidase [Actinoplanes sp. NPDC051411]|uniref:S8 family serine peptidase n=1 Tax=Actinoplanes sp. NPDC051411 TaxID=3155522 RepID=UPI0034392006